MVAGCNERQADPGKVGFSKAHGGQTKEQSHQTLNTDLADGKY